MNEQEKREQIKTKIIEDIKYLREKEQNIRTALSPYFPNTEDFAPVIDALKTVELTNFSFLEDFNFIDFKKFYTDYINQLASSSRAFLNNQSNSNTHKQLIESAKFFNEFINQLNMAKNTKDTGFEIEVEGVNLTQEIKDLYERIKILEQEQKPLNEQQIRAEQDKKELAKKIDELKQNIEHLQSSDAQIEIRGFLTQAKELLDKAKGSENLLNAEIQELKQAKEGHIAYNLSKELQHKSNNLKNEYEEKIGNFSWKFWELKGFYGAITLVLLVNIITWMFYLFAADIANICLEAKKYYRLEFSHFMMLKLTINIPLIIYVAFALNEYTKAKKLYEEFDYKRILAQTLMNNYNQFKTDFTDDKDKLLDLIKAPLEKIFDNPVHSIYGDKSGDKNIGLDQLEKFASIFEKMKMKNNS